jgi:pumilio family protein 6
VIQEDLLQWACGEASFVVLAFLESEDVPEKIQKKIVEALRKNRKKLQAAADGERSAEENGGVKVGEEVLGNGERKARRPRHGRWKNGNAGAKLLLEKLGA